MNPPSWSAPAATPEAREVDGLRAQVAWFNRLRLVVAAAVVWATAVAVHGLGLPAPPLPLYATAASILLADGVYLWLFPRLRAWPLQRVRRHVYLQIAVDLSLLTVLLHFTGGITNPFALCYLFHAFIAALVLSVAAAVVVAGASLGLLALLGIAERVGVLAYHPLGLGLVDLPQLAPLGFCVVVGAYAVTFAFSIYFVATVLGRLHRNEQRLVEIDRHLATSEKLASVGTLAAGISHEINNPIGVITNKVQVLRYRVQDGDAPDKVLAELDVIDKHARRVAQITAGLLAFSREQPFELRPLDVALLLTEAADLVRVPFHAAEVDLVCDPDPLPGIDVRGSANHLLQVLINILLNAKDASPAGSSVRLDDLLVGDEVVIRIADHGSGIPPEHLPKVFDPFFTTKDVDKGTGLGLSISHGIVERHGGRIEVESQVGLGTTFRVVLPVGLSRDS